jgi:hypothetical protein
MVISCGSSRSLSALWILYVALEVVGTGDGGVAYRDNGTTKAPNCDVGGERCRLSSTSTHSTISFTFPSCSGLEACLAKITIPASITCNRGKAGSQHPQMWSAFGVVLRNPGDPR